MSKDRKKDSLGMSADNLSQMMAQIEAKRNRTYDKDALRPYIGIPVFAELDSIIPMPPKDAPGIIDRAFNGSLIGFNTDQASTKLTKQTFDPSSLFNRAIATTLDNPVAPESIQVFSFLTTQAQNLTSGIAQLNADQIQEWWLRTKLLGEVYATVQIKKSI